MNQIYFGCLLQDELIRQNALLQKELQVNIERIKAMMDNGVANQSDLESMEVELLNARQNEIELRASRTVYRQMLATFINKPLTDQENQLAQLEDEVLRLKIENEALKLLASIQQRTDNSQK